MARYKNTKIKKSNIVRGEIDKRMYRNITSYRTTIYSSVPESDDDIYVTTQLGDRLDTLAHQFYGDVGLWWYIAKANNLIFVTVSNGTTLRIPGSTKYAIGR